MTSLRTTAGAILAAIAVLLPAMVSAQEASGIAGVVKDTSGAVLPGVTVEAASPALIEKVRTVVTDGDGRYSVVELRPGDYVVTFTLPGFSTVRRTGVELAGGFTATVNAEMRVGTLEETVTVTGAAPLVDVQNVRRQNAATDEQLATLPSGIKNFGLLIQLTPGIGLDTTGSIGTSGTAGVYRTAQSNHVLFHGKSRGVMTKYDGLSTNILYSGGSGTGYVGNSFSAEEMTVETGGGSAESNTSSVAFNMIPKDGGNIFAGSIYGHGSSGRLQSSNLTDDLRARGLTASNKVDYMYDTAESLGGPLMKDRLWFFTTHRWTGSKTYVGDVYYNKTQGTTFFTPDLSRPGFLNDRFRSNSARLTWQASPRNKINVFGDNEHMCACVSQLTVAVAPEAIVYADYLPLGFYEATWTSPVTSRLLFEGGVAYSDAIPRHHLQAEVKPSDIPVLDQLTGLSYNSVTSQLFTTTKASQRFTVSYITGSHAFKVGVSDEEGTGATTGRLNGNLSYQVRGGVPVQLSQLATPTPISNHQKADLGIFAQDRWTVRRMTLNLGVRFDYLNQYAPAQHAPAGAWVPERNFAAVYDVPAYKDIQPRFGAAYDLFGDGKTAVKATVGRYNGPGSINLLAVSNGNNPMVTSVNTVSRAWTDANNNYAPDCDLANFSANGECGQISDLNFGKLNPLATRYADDVLRGWGVRDYTWDISAEVQHQLTTGVSVNAAYYRNWFGNFTVTDNQVVVPADFSTYCVTAPTTKANGFSLPNGGGYQICGLADVSLAKFGQVTNLVTQASNYGKVTQVSNFFSVTTTGRVGSVAQFGGGLDTGRTVNNRCFVVDSPQELVNCRTVTPLRGNTQVKLFGSYQLPADVVLSGIFQNMPGQPILANYAATTTEIAPSLGRNLAACGTRVPCTSTATVPLIVPGTQFEGRRTHLDLRVSKIVRLGPKMRLQANLDVYNVLNRADILLINNTFGPKWRQPTSVMDARLAQIGGQLTF